MNQIPALELIKLSKTYLESGQQHSIIHNVSLSINRGEFVVLLGRSGSGKSTLLNLISGMDIPCSGTVSIHGQPLSNMTEKQRTLFRRHHLGFVFQSYNLIPTLSVSENLLLPLELIKTITLADHNRVLSLLDALGLAPRASTFPDRLSGGEQQRVAIARALIHNPDLILADEPTGNLDVETGDEVMHVLTRLVRENGKTLIMATHSRELIDQADRVFSIQDKTLHTVD
jgi:putative ABC transport system ATP-binding protein